MIYIVTGVSRGLGKAIAEALLNRGERVIGVGRSHSIDSSDFQFIQCDLSQPEERAALNFPEFIGPVTLINNAGILGNIGRWSQQDDPATLAKVLEVNTIAPFEILWKVYRNSDKETFRVVNISSGAATHAIPSWAAYCASKAAINMLSQAFYLEERELGHRVKVYAVAPGVIDTGMQKEIRSANATVFSSVQRFRDLKENHELYSPQEAAERLLILLDSEYEGEVLYDLRAVNR